MAREDLMALQALQGQMPEGMPQMGGPQGPSPVDELNSEVMPMATNKASGEVFVDKDLFGGEKLKRGQRVCLYGTVTSVGSKIAVQPDSGELDTEKAEDEMDDELDDDLDEEKPKY